DGRPDGRESGGSGARAHLRPPGRAPGRGLGIGSAVRWAGAAGAQTGDGAVVRTRPCRRGPERAEPTAVPRAGAALTGGGVGRPRARRPALDLRPRAAVDRAW